MLKVNINLLTKLRLHCVKNSDVKKKVNEMTDPEILVYRVSE
jgi:hypothetical protein